MKQNRPATRLALVPWILALALPLQPVHAADASSPADEPGEKPSITDEQGRVRYVVVFKSSALTRQSDRAPSVDRERLGVAEDPRMVNLGAHFGYRYGAEVIGVSTDAAPLLTTYLSEEQVEAVRADPEVDKLIRDVGLDFSASVWTDQVVSGERRPWGKLAVNSSVTSSTGGVRVYVIDAGVGFHTDLNVVQRVNPSIPGSTTPGHLVGCYAHATHVAGVIGAKADGSGSVGVRPGVNIVSVAVSPLAYYNSAANCMEKPSSIPDFVQGIKDAIAWIRNNISKTGTVGIVNISINGTQFYSDTGLRNAIADLATPTPSYPGAFVVQSAGNQEQDACLWSTGSTSTSDGRMVVGGINSYGQSATQLNGLPALRNPGIGNEKGTNYGSCVDTWGPAVDVYGPFTSSPQSASTTYSSHAYLSGTSFAAPHVAGLATYYVETLGLSTPAAIESQIRSAFSALGSTDLAGAAITLPTANPIAGPRNQPFGEFAISHTCFRPPYTTATPCTTTPSMPTVQPNGTLSVYTDATFELSFDSRGSGSYSCQVYETWSALPTLPTLLATTQRTYWIGRAPYPSGTLYYNAPQCTTANAVVNSLQPPAPHWYYNGIERTGQTIVENATQQFTYSAAASATACSINVHHVPPMGFSYLAHTVPSAGVSGTLALLPGAGSFTYNLSCQDALGGERLGWVKVVR